MTNHLGRPGNGAWHLTVRFALYGALFGCCFPLIATLLDVIWIQQIPLVFVNVLAVQRAQPLHWIIDSAPFVLAAAGGLLGDRQERAVQSDLDYRLLADNSFDVILVNRVRSELVHTNTLKLVYCSPSVERLTGYTPDEFAALSHAERYLPESVELIRETVDRERRKEVQKEARIDRQLLLDLAHRHKDGRTVWVETAVNILHSGEQGLTIVSISRDVTERRRADEALRQAQKMESVGRLAGGVAHDFNNLLSVILGNSELLQADLDLKRDQRDLVDEINEAGGRGKALTQQLLGMSRKQVAHLTRAELNSQIQSSLKLYRRLLGEDIAVDFFPDGSVLPVLVDTQQFDQVLANLLINARDAIRARADTRQRRAVTVTTVAVTVTDHEEERLHLSAGTYACVAVADTGMGMDSQTMKRVFEPFFTTKKGEAGTGLGLSTVYGVVGQNGGAVTVESVVGQGTTFRVFWPMRQAGVPDEAGHSRKAVPLAVRGGEHVLVVEDEESVRRLAGKMLGRLGYEVTLAESAEQALRLLAQDGVCPDLLVTDVVLPGMSGQELAERVRVDFAGLPILYTSGHAKDVLSNGEFAGESFELLEKPYTIEELDQKTRKMLTLS
jgi:PAS domain S-box-containing protein